jgi:RimK family alpha-L-glutamate ligase
MYCVLTEDPQEWMCQELGKALMKAHKEFIWARTTDFVSFSGRKPSVREKVHELSACQKIFVRGFPTGSPQQFTFRMNVLRRLENLGVECINSASAIEKCVNKYYTSSLLEDAGLSVPRAVCCENYDEAFAAFLEMGDVVAKPLCGTMGTNLVRIKDKDTACRVLRSFEFYKYIFYLQEYLDHNNEDVRILVCKGEVVASIKRKSQSWITNIAQGAQAEKYEPPEEMAEMAIKAWEVLSCHYCGIDIIESHGKLFLLEANAIPGWHGSQGVHDFNIAERLIKMLG